VLPKKDMIEIIGWVGGVLMPTSALPQVYKTFVTKSAEDLSILFLVWWFVGEALLLVYIIKRAPSKPLIFNYVFSGMMCASLIGMWVIYR